MKPVPPHYPITQPGRQRVRNVMALFNVSHATVYRWVADGRLPPPDGKNPRPFWNNETLLPYLVAPTPPLH